MNIGKVPLCYSAERAVPVFSADEGPGAVCHRQCICEYVCREVEAHRRLLLDLNMHFFKKTYLKDTCRNVFSFVIRLLHAELSCLKISLVE